MFNDLLEAWDSLLEAASSPEQRRLAFRLAKGLTKPASAEREPVGVPFGGFDGGADSEGGWLRISLRHPPS